MFRQFTSNQGLNIGQSTRLSYDRDYLKEKMEESTSPLLYRLNTESKNNCNGCLSTLGPRTSQGPNSYGVSKFANLNDKIAPAQQLTDLESILTNRNYRASKTRKGESNPINPLHYRTRHVPQCNNWMDPMATSLIDPPQNYRGVTVNRFYNLNSPAQLPIFYNFAQNTRLQGRDNHQEQIPHTYQQKSTWPKQCK